jgi:hypothetical protein
MIAIRGLLVAITVAVPAPIAAQATSSSPARVPIVTVAGCVREQPAGTWLLVNASDPVPSPDGPTRLGPGTVPTLGRNQFRLIGVGPFRLSSRRNHTAVVQGMQIGSSGERRLNVTSVQSVASSCDPK